MAGRKKMKKSTRSNLMTFGFVIAFWALIEIVRMTGHMTAKIGGLLIPVCAYVVMAISLNLVVGFLGELSLGHAAFMSAGAFAGIYFYTTAGAALPQWLAVLIAFLIGLLFSLKVQFSLGMEPDGKMLLKGAMGIMGIKKFSVFTVGIVLILITLIFVTNLMNSRAGRAITAIRDDEIAARATGINLTKYKLMAFVSAAVFAGFAGVLYALNYSSLVADKFDYNLSINVLVMVVLGGMGKVLGGIIAAIILTVLPEMLRGFSQYRMFIYSIVLIVMMLFNQAPAFVSWRKRFMMRFRKKAPVSGKEGI